VIATGANVGKTAGRLRAGALIASLGVTSVFLLAALTGADRADSAAVSLGGARPVYALVGVTMAIGAIPIAALVQSLGGLRPLRAS
jgi:hypothetical protein